MRMNRRSRFFELIRSDVFWAGKLHSEISWRVFPAKMLILSNSFFDNHAISLLWAQAPSCKAGCKDSTKPRSFRSVARDNSLVFQAFQKSRQCVARSDGQSIVESSCGKTTAMRWIVHANQNLLFDFDEHRQHEFEMGLGFPTTAT